MFFVGGEDEARAEEAVGAENDVVGTDEDVVCKDEVAVGATETLGF